MSSDLIPSSAPLAPLDLPKGLVGRGMPRRLGLALRMLVGRQLERVTIGAEDLAMVRELATRGTVVWVHRARNPVEHMALTHVVDREGLPRAAFVGGLNVFALQGLGALGAWSRRGPGNARREEELLQRCIEAQLPAELFLKRPLHLLSTSSTMRARYIEALVRVQRQQERPIFLVPVFLALRQRPGHFEPTAVDAILGSVEEPGLLRALGRLFAAGGTARIDVSEAVDLKRFIAERGDAPDDVVAKKVRWTILHHLARVERVAHGPAMKSPARMRDDVLKDPKLQTAMSALATSTQQAPAVVEKKAMSMYDEIAARFDVDVARLLDRLLQAAWQRIYDAIVVDEGDVEMVRQAARRGPLVLVPSHRSHVDYLVMSQVMIQHGMLPPHIAAGENLSFFPLGPILRRGGAFFLRRSFKGDVLYGAVFRAYVRRLFEEGLTQEFFIEGGRSRTGKTLPPKLGLLSMLVDAWLESREDDAVFVPCHIAYEKIVEATSYTKELGGAAKQKESAAGLVKAAGVLAGRYGKVFVTFDEPISIKAHMASRGLRRDDVDGGLDPDALRAATASLGHRIAWGINRAGVVTAMSLVCASLFGFRRKGLDERQLIDGARSLLAHVVRAGGKRFEAGLTEVDPTPLLAAALQKLVDDRLVHRQSIDGRVLYRVDDQAWLIIDVHKNHVLHHAVPEAIIATALLAAGARPGVSVPRVDVKRTALELSRVLKLEFIFQPGVPFDALFDTALEHAHAVGFVAAHVDSDEIVVPDAAVPRAAWLFAHQLIRGFIDCYKVVASRITALLPDGERVDERVVVTSLLEAVRAGVASGDLVAAEAASRAPIDNALALLIERGVVVRDGKQLRRGDVTRLAELSQLLTAAQVR